jgi:hypothetical protein
MSVVSRMENVAKCGFTLFFLVPVIIREGAEFICSFLEEICLLFSLRGLIFSSNFGETKRYLIAVLRGLSLYLWRIYFYL